MTTTTHKIVDTGWNASEWTRDVWIGDWLIRAVTTDDQAGKEYVTHYYSGPKDRIANAWLSEDEVPAEVLRLYDEHVDATAPMEVTRG